MVSKAATVPIFPISSATPSNFYYKGVGGYSSISFSFNLPIYVSEPTVQIKIFPDPSITFEPEIINGVNGEGLSSFSIIGILLIISDSPVIALSSICNSLPSSRIPSTYKMSPI